MNYPRNMHLAGIVLSVALVGGLAVAQIRPEVSPTELVIESSPKADVFLDGKSAGKIGTGGRLVIANPTPGEHTIRVELLLKKAFERKVTIAPGKPMLVKAILIDETGDLEILTTPGAEVLLNGKPAGVADITGRLLMRGLKVLTYKVSSTHRGYNSEEREFQVFPDVITSLTIDLKPFVAATQATTEAPPDYVLHRRLVGHRSSAYIKTAFRTDSTQLISWQVYDNHAIVWEPVSGRLVRTVELEEDHDVSGVSPDQRWLAVSGPHKDRGVTLLVEVETGSIVRRLSKNEDMIVRVVFSPDQKRLVTVSQRNEAIVWNLENGNRLYTWTDPSVLEVAYSADGHLVATGEEGVTLWDPTTGKEVRRLPVRERVRGGLAFSPDGRWLAVANSHIELWEAGTGKPGRIITPGSEPGQITYTPDSRYLASAHRDGIHLWDPATGGEVRRWRGPLEINETLAFSPNGDWMAASGNDILTVWRRVK